MIEVSIIIPCRNEKKYIARCLQSVVSQDFPQEKLEVLVIDGVSEDGTRGIVQEYALKYPFIRLLENTKKFTPFGLNIGVKEARGEYVIRMDAHAEYEKNYISQCLKYSKEFGADNVGGVIRTLPANKTIMAKAIALVLSSPLGAASSFRLGSREVREVDTVFGGCYRKEVFGKVGLFDERMLRSQDIEFNKRLKKASGKIILAPEIVAAYYPQAALSAFIKHNFQDGFWVTYPLKFGIRYFSPRHLFPLFLTGAAAIGFFLALFSFAGKAFFISLLGVYLAALFLFSLRIAPNNREFGYFWALPLAALSRHFAYGLGSFWGLIKILL